jgi:hypothetical protein
MLAMGSAEAIVRSRKRPWAMGARRVFGFICESVIPRLMLVVAHDTDGWILYPRLKELGWRTKGMFILSKL